MSITRPRPRPLIVNNGPRKKISLDFDVLASSNVGSLSPDLQPNSPPNFQSGSETEHVVKIGKYIVVDPAEIPQSSHAVDVTTGEECVCKIFPLWEYRDALAAYWQADSHPNVTSVHEIVTGETRAYVFFPRHYGDLHSYVRQRKRLKEDECRLLFSQIVAAVEHCHAAGLVLRDLKMRKFVFSDPNRTILRLEGLEDAVVLEGDADQLADRHGCPAYVSPEILSAGGGGYSGRAADLWSLGVMLYTMLVGRYPFHDPLPLALFGKIRRGTFMLPDFLSSRARCLLRCLLRREPEHRLIASDVSRHPWFRATCPSPTAAIRPGDRSPMDQKVPDLGLPEDIIGL